MQCNVVNELSDLNSSCNRSGDGVVLTAASLRLTPLCSRATLLILILILLVVVLLVGDSRYLGLSLGSRGGGGSRHLCLLGTPLAIIIIIFLEVWLLLLLLLIYFTLFMIRRVSTIIIILILCLLLLLWHRRRRRGGGEGGSSGCSLRRSLLCSCNRGGEGRCFHCCLLAGGPTASLFRLTSIGGLIMYIIITTIECLWYGIYICMNIVLELYIQLHSTHILTHSAPPSLLVYTPAIPLNNWLSVLLSY